MRNVPNQGIAGTIARFWDLAFGLTIFLLFTPHLPKENRISFCKEKLPEHSRIRIGAEIDDLAYTCDYT